MNHSAQSSQTALAVLGLASRAWPAVGKPSGRVPRLSVEWLRALEAHRAQPGSIDSDALRTLATWHRQQACPDLRRVHPSWIDRALHDESPAVREAVRSGLAGSGPPGESAELGPFHATREPLYRIVAVARILWSERLLGDRPPHDGDPPVIRALTAEPRPLLQRRLRQLGLAKRRASLEPLDEPPAASRDLQSLARRDCHRVVDEATPEATDDRYAAPLGLISVARLLGTVDPYRVRWALQHLPYAVARRIRVLIESDPALIRLDPVVQAWENALWRQAEQALAAEDDPPPARRAARDKQ